MRQVLFVVVILSTISCGSDSSGPSSSPPSTAQIAGVWRGTVTATAVTVPLSGSGGECFSPSFLSQIVLNGTGPATMTFAQNGFSASATLTYAAGNLNYTGSFVEGGLTMGGSTCSGCSLPSAQCPNGNGMRELRFQTSSLSGMLAGSSLSGRMSQTYNVFVAGTSTQTGTVDVSSSFSLARQ